MPICPLPQETVRLLGSPLVYSTPVSVVKELVNNALDAEATSVEIFISANTIDCIEVRDNGHGIDPSDFDSLGHRGCTSKLRNFEDIQTVGGTTLGFRGDALACAANLSILNIVTRTATEPTAWLLTFSEKGGVTEKSRVSRPVGTTVNVTGLFTRLPVRKQVAVKECSKTLSSIRNLLHSYAFARPRVRLTFRVLKNNISWSYSPGSHGGTIKQAAFHAFGAELVSQCVEKASKNASGGDEVPRSESAAISETRGKGSYTFDALLPKPGADPTKLCKGAWFSVDSRPVSASKGTIKTLYSVVKARFRHTCESGRLTPTLKQLFVAVNITCPPRSYDPNVEPSKDEVLFANSNQLIEAFERFLEEECPLTPPPSSSREADLALQIDTNAPNQPPATVEPHENISRPLSSEHTSVDDPPSTTFPGTNLPVDTWIQGLLGTAHTETQQTPVSPRMTVNDIRNLEQAAQASHYKSPPSSGVLEQGSMRKVPRHDVPNTTGNRDGQITNPVDLSPQNAQDDIRGTINNVPDNTNGGGDGDIAGGHTPPIEGLNPWVIAKFNAVRNRQSGAMPQPVQQPVQQPAGVQDIASPPIAVPDSLGESSGALGMRPVVRLDAEGPSAQQRFGSNSARRRPAPVVPGGAFRSPLSSSRGGNFDTTKSSQRQPQTRMYPRGSLSSLQRADGASRQVGRNTEHDLDQDDRDNNWFQGSVDFTGRGTKRRRREKAGGIYNADVDGDYRPTASQEEPDVSPDLGATRRRQALAESRRRREPPPEWLNSSEETAAAAVPPTREQVQPARAQPDVPDSHTGVMTGLAAGDPRAYLLRKDCSVPARTPRKLRRVKSCMLPLETTPAGAETYNFNQIMHVDMEELCESFEANYGHHLTNAGVKEDMDTMVMHRLVQDDLREICRRVNVLLSEMGLESHNGCQIEFNVQQAAKAITTATSSPL